VTPRVHRLLAVLLLIAVAGLGAEPLRAAPQGTSPAAPGPDAIENSVVKVFSTARYPDPYKPWTKQAPTDVTASGVVIEGRRILTNAHVVLYASQVQVQANQAGDKLSANVEFIAPGIDLAVLKLDDETFFETHRPLPRASALPAIKDAVLAYGYPTGGTSLSITKGIVSRIEFLQYSPSVFGLRVQIDAAINPGNSGGPAVVADRMIGLAFSHLGGADNIGYIIPCEEIELFLKDIADGRYDGKPAMYDDLQTLENEALRSFLKVPKSIEGIVVHKVFSDDPAYPLKEWDVITRIGDTPVDDQGMIQIGANLRVRFQYLIQRLARDGKVPLRVARGSREIDVDLPVASSRPMLLLELQGAYPSYFVYGPLVFSTATMEFLGGAKSSGAGGASFFNMIGSSLMKRMLDRPAFDGESLAIVSSPFFPHKLAKGYGNPAARVVRSVNGVAVRNLAHLVQILRDSKEEFIVIQYDGLGGEGIVFPREAMVAATDEILTDNGVRSQGSPDTLAVWNARPGP
jgi:S1-C subfamily serine protease